MRKDQEVPERISGQGGFIQGFLDEKMKCHTILNHFRQTRSSDALQACGRLQEERNPVAEKTAQ